MQLGSGRSAQDRTDSAAAAADALIVAIGEVGGGAESEPTPPPASTPAVGDASRAFFARAVDTLVKRHAYDAAALKGGARLALALARLGSACSVCLSVCLFVWVHLFV